jgi:hypothetical protein
MEPRIFGFLGLRTSTVMRPLPAWGAHLFVAKLTTMRPGLTTSTSLSLPGQWRNPTFLGALPDTS